jgi:hypothetical protein
MTKYQYLLSRHIATSLLKQHNLDEFLDKHNWNLDTTSGKVDFGKGRVYPIQVVGTESEGSATWLWSWANAENGIPENLVACATKLKAVGEKEEIAELVQPELSLGTADGHQLSLIASGACQADAYCRGPYAGGAVFFTIHQTPLPNLPAASPMMLINTMSAAISSYAVDHKIMARSFLQQQKLELTETADQITATSADGTKIFVIFDAQDRIAKMNTTAVPPVKPAAKKPWWQSGK